MEVRTGGHMGNIPDPGYYTLSEAQRLAPEPLHVEIGSTSSLFVLFSALLLLQGHPWPTPGIALMLGTLGTLGFLAAVHRHHHYNTPLYRMRHTNIGKYLLRYGETLRGIRDHSGIKLPTEEEFLSEQQHLLLNHLQQE